MWHLKERNCLIRLYGSGRQIEGGLRNIWTKSPAEAPQRRRENERPSRVLNRRRVVGRRFIAAGPQTVSGMKEFRRASWKLIIWRTCRSRDGMGQRVASEAPNFRHRWRRPGTEYAVISTAKLKPPTGGFELFINLLLSNVIKFNHEQIISFKIFTISIFLERKI